MELRMKRISSDMGARSAELEAFVAKYATRPGIKPGEAAEGLRRTLRALNRATGPAQKALADIGLPMEEPDER